MMKKLISFLLLLFLTTPAYSIRKPHYGGALRVADSLLQRINEQTLFIASGDNVVPTIPLPFEIQETEVRLDLSRINPELMVDVENAVAAIQDHENACHWILDYPFFDHRHPNQIQMESGTLIIKSTDADYLGQYSCRVVCHRLVLRLFVHLPKHNLDWKQTQSVLQAGHFWIPLHQLR